MRLFSSLLVLTLLASTAQADRNYCDRKDSRAQGTIIGGLAGGGLGAAIDHGGTGGVLIGAGVGAIAGRLLGHQIDVDHSRRDCGEDAAPDLRRQARDDERYEEEAMREDYRQDRIEEDRAYSRARYGRQRRHRPRYECQDTGRQYVLVDLYMNEIVRDFGYNLRACRYTEMRANQR